MEKKIIYTDGNGDGGWGAVIIDQDMSICKLSGYEMGRKTNQRLEIISAIHALEYLKCSCDIVLYTDSKYLIGGGSLWIREWERNNWKTKKHQPVKNKDLWEKLHEVSKLHRIKYKWVKGHSGNKFNEMCDEMSTIASTSKLNPQITECLQKSNKNEVEDEKKDILNKVKKVLESTKYWWPVFREENKEKCLECNDSIPKGIKYCGKCTYKMIIDTIKELDDYLTKDRYELK